MNDTSYRQKRCAHGWVDVSQCEICTPIKQTEIKPLTNEEIDGCFASNGWSPSDMYYPVVRDIERLLASVNRDTDA